MGSLTPKAFNVKNIAIIGAGPCGLSAAKYLQAQDSFDRIVIFEQQDEVGGVWNYVKQQSPPTPAPQLDPFYLPDAPLQLQPNAPPVFPSPMYEKLHSNIPAKLMNFSDQKFVEDERLFPERSATQRYLVRYAADIRHLVKFCQQVKRISPSNNGSKTAWTLEAQSTLTGETLVDTFDAVVIANGHYSVPYVPDIKNIADFHKAHPTIISHSKNYRTTEPFRDKKVIVVGNGPSGIDIAGQVRTVAREPPMLSVRHATPPERLAHTGCVEVPEIVEFLVESRGVRFSDGRVESDIDAIIFSTGFLFSFPFLRDLQKQLIRNGHGVHGLYKHLFMVEHPTLVFPGLNMKAIPWEQSEAQAALFSAVWANTLQLPPQEEMERWSKELSDRKGEKLLIFEPREDGEYINELHDWVMQASFVGKEPPRWDDEVFWLRTIFYDLKLRFEEGGCKAKTIEELGFHYEPPGDHRTVAQTE
ncbi:hypothetical protein S40285_04910 [Stachybotrys chlorohalonatus IBT 40285]|uniref:FAD/NAD(P)-binding domain-containing protein n=1 Tax=Stachybotrys chlorohalonatus (strain IBT 40285) TaxID=1283841 RepID=A0A084QGX9_STAC4|nr:hypothetical protein S40285_04910 [Stachybotrys chlorohalonata IBT 40285]